MTAVLRRALDRMDGRIGGRHRRRIVLVLAVTLGLDSADKASLGTTATQLQQALHIGPPQIGLLLTVSGAVSTLAAVPFGLLVDRRARVRLLLICVAGWGVTTALSGCAPGFTFLAASRSALGVAAAVVGPAVASLLGDYFPEQERSGVYGYVLAGELVGAGFGFVVSGQFAALSWRAPFFVLGVASIPVCYWLRRLPEPSRAGAGGQPAHRGHAQRSGTGDSDASAVDHVVRREEVPPRGRAVLDAEPRRLSLLQAARYVVRIPTNLALIVASALGYFFFSGLRGFAVSFAHRQYGVPSAAAAALALVIGVGALAGVLIGGRTADRRLARGQVGARVLIPGVCSLLAALTFVPALLTHRLWVALPVLTLAATFLGAVNPPLDAARLDVVHPLLRGRAESVRTVLRSAGDAAAPLVFGVLAGSVFGGSSALQRAFLVMLTPLLIGAVVTLVWARAAYPGDVAAAVESRRRFPPGGAPASSGDVSAAGPSEPRAGRVG